MRYLKFNNHLIEVQDDYKPEYVAILFRENGIQAEGTLVKFEELSPEDKIRALDLRLKHTERQLQDWRDIAVKLREAILRVPKLTEVEFPTGYRLV